MGGSQKPGCPVGVGLARCGEGWRGALEGAARLSLPWQVSQRSVQEKAGSNRVGSSRPLFASICILHKLSPTPLQRISWGREQVLGARGAPGEPPVQILDPAIPQPLARGGAGAPGAAPPFSESPPAPAGWLGRPRACPEAGVD